MAQVGSKIRPAVSSEDIVESFRDVWKKLMYRLETKGHGSYASRHEIYGILVEEMDELLDELRINTPTGYKNFQKELLDVAVGAIFGYVCMHGGYIKPPKKKR